MTVSDRYDVVVDPTPRWMVPGLMVAATVVSVIGQSEPFTYGRRRARIRDRSSGELVGRFVEPRIVTRYGRFGLMLTATDTLGSDEFERAWLESDDNLLTVGDT